MNNSSELCKMSVQDMLLTFFDAISDEGTTSSREDVFAALRARLDTMSVQELLKTVLALAYDAQPLLLPTEVFCALRFRTGQNLGDDVDQWIKWFLQNSGSTDDIENKFIYSMYKLHKIRHRALRRLEKQKKELK